MADLMAVISKAVFESTSRGASIGDVLPIDRYTSNNKALASLAEPASRLFLFTVRPPDEELWLVAILSDLEHDGTAWVGAENTTPVTNIGGIKAKIKFASGVGIKAKKGALGMSLQTPRALTVQDVALLEATDGGTTKGAKGKAPAKSTAKSKPKAAAAKLAFKFVNERSHDAKTLMKLDAVHRSQVLEALTMYSGTRWDTIKEALAGFEEENGFPLEMQQWDVIDATTKEPVYEYWVQGAGDGSIFEYGTDSCDNCLGSTQHSFESHGDQDEATLAIVAALQAAADKTL